MVVSFAQTDFSVFALTPNQIAVANAAQFVPAITTALNAVPTAGEIPAALNALSPQGYEVWSDIAFAQTASLAYRLASQPAATPGRENFYFEAGQSRGYTYSDLDIGSTRYTSNSGLVGGNFAVGQNITLGALFEYTESDASLGSRGSSTTVKGKLPGVRAAWDQGPWFADAVVAYGFDDYKSTRVINFPGTSEIAHSKTTGNKWLADVSGGRRFEFGPATLAPFAGVQFSGWDTKRFTETGAGIFNATVENQSAESFRSQVGLEAAFGFSLGNALVRPRVRGAWIHEFSNDSRSIDAAFGAVNYTIVTRDPQRDSARLSAGLDVSLSPTVSLYGDYSMQTGDVTRVIGEWRAGVSIRF